MEEDEKDGDVPILSPEEIRKRRLAYFQTEKKPEISKRPDQFEDIKEHLNDKSNATAKDSIHSGSRHSKNMKESKDLIDHDVQSKFKPFHVSKYDVEKHAKSIVHVEKEDLVEQVYFHRKSEASRDILQRKHHETKLRMEKEKIDFREGKVEELTGKSFSPKESSESVKKKLENAAVMNVSRESPDEFTVLREELKTMNREDDEAGYDARVEKLIQLTKQEIAQREQRAEKVSSRLTQETRNNADGRNNVAKHSEKVKGDSLKPPIKQKPQNHISNIDPPRQVDQVEEFFVKGGRESNRISSERNKLLLDSQDDGSVVFHKSVNFDKVQELGLSTHRGDTERDGGLLPSVLARENKEESPRALQDFESNGLKAALGDKKYQEFVRKSVKEIKDMDFGKKSPKGGTKNRNLKDSAEKYMDENDFFQSSSTKVERKVASVSGISKSGGQVEQRCRSHDLQLNLKDVNHVAVEDSQDGGDTNRDINIPRLNRPRYEPSNIYQQEEDNEDYLSLPPSYRAERTALPRNVVFSTSQIYQQAFRDPFSHMMVSYPGPPGVPSGSPGMMPGAGRSYYGQSPSVYQSMQFPGHPLAGIHPSSPGFYPPHQQPVSMATPYQMMAPHPPGGGTYAPTSSHDYMVPPTGQIRMTHPMYEGGDNPFHQQLTSRSQHSNDGFGTYRGMPVHPARMPHPPEGEHPPQYAGDASRFVPHQPTPPSVSLHYDTMASHGQPYSARSSVDGLDFRQPHQPLGIPYPPPPNNMDLEAYLKFMGAQGYPVPYPVFIPHQVAPPAPVQASKPQETTSNEAVESENIPGEVCIPHPPLQAKEENPSHPTRKISPRRNIKQDPSSTLIPTPEPQVHAPQLKSGHTTSSMTVVRDEIEVKKVEERDMPSEALPGSSSSQRHVEAIRQYHEQRRQLDAEEDAILEKNRKFATASLERYFTSLEQHYRRRDKQSEEKDIEDSGSVEIPEEQNIEGDDLDMETHVNTEVTQATSVKAGGITNRMEQLGIDLSFLKVSQNVEKKEGSEAKPKKSKVVVICPECEEINKEYMSWCGKCGEMLIGVDAVSVKKTKTGKLLVKPLESSKKVSKAKEPKISSSEENTDGDACQNEVGDVSNTVDEMFKQDGGEASAMKKSQKRVAKDTNERSQKEIAEICESITDPIVKGFVKSFLKTKKHDVTNADIQTEETLSDRDVTSRRSVVKSKAEGKVPKQRVDASVQKGNMGSVSKVKKKPVSSRTEKYPQDRKTPEPEKKMMESQQKIKASTSKVENDPSVKPSTSKLENDMSKKVYSRKVKKSVVKEENVNDFFTQNKSDNSEDDDKEDNFWHHEQGHKKRVEKPLHYQNMQPIDIEVFAMEESRRSSRSAEPLVPSLNLVNSSDEEEERREKSKIISMSADSDDWEDLFHTNPRLKVPLLEEEAPNLQEEENSQPFLERVLGDLEASNPSKKDSQNRKKGSGVPPIRKSIVRESIETPGYQRKWEKSSTAWASYHPRELNTRASGPVRAQRPSSAGMTRKSGSEENLLKDRSPTRGPVQSKRQRPVSAGSAKRQTKSQSENSTVDVTSTAELKKIGVTMSVNFEKHSDLPRLVEHRLPTEEVSEIVEPTHPDPGGAEHAYSKYHEMTPRIRVGDYSMWLCLPDEILLHVFSYLSHSDLAKCARVCKQYHRVAKDSTLWKYITLKKKHDLTDDDLYQIGRHQPCSLALIQCHGDDVTAKGLREMFKECGDSLRELNFCGCSRGALTGDCILLHASARCRNLTHVDASWCNVSDSGVGAISSAANKLESLCINGCQLLSDDGFETVIKKHGKSLRVIEMFGCFNITPKGMRYLANNCLNLTTLNLGQCYKLTDICISQLSSSLGRIESLDLRGCKTIKDNCMRYVVKNCPRLKTISLANCPNITDVSLLEISTYLTDIRSIDVCGCRHVTDNSIRAIANNCQNLRYIDISSTGCTHRGVSMLANFCSQRIETMKLNFLSDLTEACLTKLLKHCKRLKLLHLYGCTSARNIDKIKQINRAVKIEL